MVESKSNQPRPHREYIHPPIIDAVIELRFAEELSEAEKFKLSEKFADEYELAEELVSQRISVSVNPNSISASSDILDRFVKRSKIDQPHIVNIGTKIFGTGVLAPYDGWESLFERFRDGWKKVRKHTKHRTIDRIGVRYVNRLDLKPNGEGVVDYEDFLNLRINLPSDFQSIFDYDLTFRTVIESIGCGVTVRSGLAPPAVPGRSSFFLDVDVWKDLGAPQKEADVYKLLQDMRVEKNNLFETFITDRARELFNEK